MSNKNSQLKMVSLRLPKSLIPQLKVLAVKNDGNNPSYQKYIRQLLVSHVALQALKTQNDKNSVFVKLNKVEEPSFFTKILNYFK